MGTWKQFDNVVPKQNRSPYRVTISPRLEKKRRCGITVRIGYDVLNKLNWDISGKFVPVHEMGEESRIGFAPSPEPDKGWKPQSPGSSKKSRTIVLCMCLPPAIEKLFCPGDVRTEWEFEIEDSVLVLSRPLRRVK